MGTNTPAIPRRYILRSRGPARPDGRRPSASSCCVTAGEEAPRAVETVNQALPSDYLGAIHRESTGDSRRGDGRSSLSRMTYRATLLSIVLLLGCGSRRTTSDAGPDAGPSTVVDAGAFDAGPMPDSSVDAGPTLDAGVDGGSTPDSGVDAGTPSRGGGELDLLFMVDNSNSMVEEQLSLTAEFPRLVNVLVTGDFEGDGSTTGPNDFAPFDLNVGIITSDMGTGGYTVPTCTDSNVGDDGILRRTGRTDLGCAATYPAFLNFRPGTGMDPAAFADEVTCVALVGTGGCGFEQPLDAVLKALSPSAATSWTAPGYAPPIFFRGTFGHGDGPNAGFVRDGSVLTIVPLTDENDCSALDPDIFNPTSPAYGGTDLNLRCFAHDSALHPLARYVDGLAQLRATPSRLVYAPIVGIPVDLVAAPGASPDYDALVSADPALRDDRMEERVDPATGRRLLPSCDVTGRGVAFPPIRLVEVARGLEARGAQVTVQSICQSSYRSAITEIILRSAAAAAP